MLRCASGWRIVFPSTQGKHAERDEWKKQSMNKNLILGSQIQIDRSGVGSAWRDIHADDIPANIREEIECEMIDGDATEITASNGMRYRW